MAWEDNIKKCEVDLISAEGILQRTRNNSFENTQPACLSQHTVICICILMLNHFVSPESKSHTCASSCE